MLHVRDAEEWRTTRHLSVQDPLTYLVDWSSLVIICSFLYSILLILLFKVMHAISCILFLLVTGVIYSKTLIFHVSYRYVRVYQSHCRLVGERKSGMQKKNERPANAP